MTKDEISLLLYLESCCVDRRGFVQAARMNASDFSIAERWHTESYIVFKRLKIAELKRHNKGSGGIKSLNARTHVVRLSPKAWDDAHIFRRERADRNCEPLVVYELCGE